MTAQNIYQNLHEKIDWPKFLERHDLIWDTLPEQWEEGAFLGNGLLGAMIYSAEDGRLFWEVGRSDVTEHRNHPAPSFAKCRLPIGRFYLETVGKRQGGTIRLDLWNAEAVGTVTTEAGEIAWRSYVHTQEKLIVIELEAAAPELEFSLVFVPAPAVNPRQVHRKEPIDHVNPAPVNDDREGIQLTTQTLELGGGYTTGYIETSSAPGKKTYLISIGFSYRPNEHKQEVLAALKGVRNLEELLSSHRQWWHQYYPQSFVSIPDTRMESFYWIQMYKLASATRGDRPAMDLMGPWFGGTPWPVIWWNLNIQLAYWPVYAANRLELGESLLRMLDDNMENLIHNVAPQYRQDSAAIGRSSSYDCVREVGNELCNLPWACHNYWLHYRHLMDDQRLREGLYPLLRRSINYYIHLLTLGEDNRYHLPVAMSPEYPQEAADCNIDLSLLRWGCETLLWICERLQVQDKLIPKWREVLERLTDYPTDETGLMIGKDVPLAISHRHYSHLLMIYPLHLMNWDQPENRSLIERSLDHWIKQSGKLQGYSYTGASAMSAWIGRKDDAVRLLNEFLDLYVKPNTMYLEAGPVIETPLSGASTIHELLLQCWGGYLSIFAAVPDSWADAAFHNLRAEGAFLVSAVRKEGRTQWIRIESLAGEPCRIQSDLGWPLAYQADREIAMKRDEQQILEIDLKKGESIFLYPLGKQPEFEIEPIAAQEEQRNHWGSRACRF